MYNTAAHVNELSTYHTDQESPRKGAGFLKHDHLVDGIQQLMLWPFNPNDSKSDHVDKFKNVGP